MHLWLLGFQAGRSKSRASWVQILVNMLNQGLFNELHGCVSTGKEANVYQASTADGNDLAVKIFKTSILTFKDRNRCSILCKS